MYHDKFHDVLQQETHNSTSVILSEVSGLSSGSVDETIANNGNHQLPLQQHQQKSLSATATGNCPVS